MNGRTWLVLGAALGGLGVATGAFGSHFLPTLLEKIFVVDSELRAALARQPNWEIAVRYQIYHALAMVLIGLFTLVRKSMLANFSALFMFVGVLIFCGCLYANVLTGQKVFGMIVPIGGLSFILGWFLLFLAAYRINPEA